MTEMLIGRLSGPATIERLLTRILEADNISATERSRLIRYIFDRHIDGSTGSTYRPNQFINEVDNLGQGVHAVNVPEAAYTVVESRYTTEADSISISVEAEPIDITPPTDDTCECVICCEMYSATRVRLQMACCQQYICEICKYTGIANSATKYSCPFCRFTYDV